MVAGIGPPQSDRRSPVVPFQHARSLPVEAPGPITMLVSDEKVVPLKVRAAFEAVVGNAHNKGILSVHQLPGAEDWSW